MGLTIFSIQVIVKLNNMKEINLKNFRFQKVLKTVYQQEVDN